MIASQMEVHFEEEILEQEMGQSHVTFKKPVESYLLGILGCNFRTVGKKHEK